MMEPKVVILMFASGKLVCTGAKTEREAYEAVYKLKRILGEVNVMKLSFLQGRCHKQAKSKPWKAEVLAMS